MLPQTVTTLKGRNETIDAWIDLVQTESLLEKLDGGTFLMCSLVVACAQKMKSNLSGGPG